MNIYYKSKNFIVTENGNKKNIWVFPSKKFTPDECFFEIDWDGAKKYLVKIL